MRRIRNATVMMLLLATLTGPSLAAAPAARDALLDEVVVEATRAKLREMRRQMVDLEDRFYDRYNGLNGNDNYDIHCGAETSAGTRLVQRHCRPVFEARAIETESIDYFIMLQKTTDSYAPMPAGSVPPPAPAILAIEAQRPDFRKNMIEVTRKNPELLNLLRERDKLLKRYEAAKRQAARQRITEEAAAR